MSASSTGCDANLNWDPLAENLEFSVTNHGPNCDKGGSITISYHGLMISSVSYGTVCQGETDVVMGSMLRIGY